MRNLLIRHHNIDHFGEHKRRRRIGAGLAALSLLMATGLAGVVSAVPAAAVTTTWYVAPSGTDTNTTACTGNSTTSAFPTIQDALVCAQSGDTIVLAATGASSYPGFGTVTRNVTIEAAPGQNASTIAVAADGGSLLVDPGAVASVTGVNLTGGQAGTSIPSVTNEGTLTLSADTVTGNASGTGILNTTVGATPAALTLSDSTVSNNTYGGGIDSKPGSGATGALSVTIVDSTIAGNEGGSIHGGLTVAGGSATLIGSTITGNAGLSTAGGITVVNSTVTLSDTVVAGNTGASGSAAANCSIGTSTVTDGPGGHNLIGLGGCGSLVDGTNGDQVGVSNPGLAPLANNGGPTATVALLPGSPAIGTGSATTCAAAPISNLDQRGLPRNATTRGTCDIGAYDTGGAAVAPANTYYVAPSGTDTNTTTCAGNSPTNAFPTIQDALACAQNGDTVVLAATGSAPYPGFGTVSNNVTIQAAPGQDARTVVVDVNGGGLVVHPGAVVTVTGVTFAGSTGSVFPSVTNDGNLTLSADTVTGNFSGGIVNQTPAVIITTIGTLPSGAVGTAYSTSLQAIGGTPTWALASGLLPSGLTLDTSTGAISGTPTAAGTTSFSVQATYSNLHGRATDTATVSITVAPTAPTTLSIIDASLPGGGVGDTYSASLGALGGTAPDTWGVTSGSLPAGLSLDTSTGAISGSPDAPGTTAFTVKATDSTTPTPQTATATLSITVVPTATSSTLTVIGSTVSGNFGSGIDSGPGAGVVTGSLVVAIANSTIAGNAGGLALVDSSATVTGSTITGNAGTSVGGISVTGAGSPVTLSDTVVAGNRNGTFSQNCSASATGATDGPGGHNLIGSSVGTSCPGLANGVNGAQVGVSNPGLGALADNGGPTDTVALQPGSPAIGAGSASTCTVAPIDNLDQRGLPRNAATRGTCDIGAYDTGGATVLAPPTGLTAAAGNGTVALAWTAPTAGGGATVTGYNVFEGATSGGESATPVNASLLSATATSYAVTGLTNGTGLYFTVEAVYATGSSGPSNEVSASPGPSSAAPGAPTNLTAAPSSTSVALVWTAPTSSGSSAITGYNVFEGTTSGGESATPVNGTTLITGSSYTVTGLTNGTTYYFTVEAVNTVGSSSVSNEASATPGAPTVPGASTNLTAAPSSTQVSLSWVAPASNGGSAVTGYNVFEGTTSGGESATPVNASLLPATATSYTVGSLTNGTTYYFTVEAVNSVGSSVASNEASAAVGTPTAAGAPTNLIAAPSSTAVTLNWTAPASDGGSQVTGYNVFEGTSAGGESVTPVNGSNLVTSDTLLVSGLTNGTAYYFTVEAVNAVGSSSVSNEASATPGAPTVPGVPTGVSATAGLASAGTTPISFAWTPPVSDGGSAITGYNIYEGTTPGGESTFTINTFPVTASTFDSTVTANGTTYYFTVKAVNAVGSSVASAEASVSPPAPPGAPTALTATAGNASVSLSWTAPASIGASAITGYVVTPYIGFVAQTSQTFDTTATTDTLTGLTTGTTYTFTVEAINAAGSGIPSASSNPAGPATLPGAPTIGTATAGNASVSVTWTAPASNGGSPITGYVVTPFIGSTAQTPQTFNTTATTDTVTGLTNGTAYTFTVAAINVAGTGVASGASNSVTPANTVPGPPTIGTATAGDTVASVTWTAPATIGTSAITGYVVTPYSGTTAQTSQTFNTTATTDTVTGLANGTAYTFTVAAINSSGTGVASAPSNAVTPATLPGAPTIGTATAAPASATVSWTAPTSDGGSPISGYLVTPYVGTTAQTPQTFNAASTNVQVPGLTNGTTYTLTVAAINDVGTGPASAPSNAVTPVAVPGVPTIGSAVAGNASATVSWSAPASDGGSPISGYYVTPYIGTTAQTAQFFNTAATTETATGLTNGTTYTFTVIAANGLGLGLESAPSNSVTPATVPGTPTGLTATAGNASATLTWTAPTSNGGSAITGYVVTPYIGTTAQTALARSYPPLGR